MSMLLACLIIGDSIGVGTKMFAPKECVSYSKGGWNTWQWNRKWGNTPLEAKKVVISLGTNDHSGVNTYKELNKIRHRIRSQNVVWILPPCNQKFCKPLVNAAVQQIAAEHTDTVIKTNSLQPDHIHPSWRGYKELVQKAGL
jgi:lysophospholipase L1-like esterase